MSTYDEQAFEAAVVAAVHVVENDERMVLGVVDRVPVDAQIDWLAAIPSLIAASLSA